MSWIYSQETWLSHPVIRFAFQLLCLVISCIRLLLLLAQLLLDLVGLHTGLGFRV